jgi:hypothetical protein
VLAPLHALVAAPALAQSPPPTPCSSPEHRQFDFWLGECGVRGRWHQTRVDSSGLLLQLDGGLVDGRMLMEGESVGTDGTRTRHRIRWTPNAEGSVRQLWRSTNAAGEWSKRDSRWTRGAAQGQSRPGDDRAVRLRGALSGRDAVARWRDARGESSAAGRSVSVQDSCAQTQGFASILQGVDLKQPSREIRFR